MTPMTDAHTPALSTAAWETRDTRLVAIGLAIAAVAAIAAQVTGLVKIQAVVGLISILLIAYLWSTNRRAIDRRTVAWGLSLQILFALIVLKTNAGQWTFATLGGLITKLLGFADVGSSFVFGPLGDKTVWPEAMVKIFGPDRGCLLYTSPSPRD